MKRLEEQVTELAKWSCGQVQQEIIRRGGVKQWTASFDGFYLTGGGGGTIRTTPLLPSMTSLLVK